jgi:hypothetical protein
MFIRGLFIWQQINKIILLGGSAREFGWNDDEKITWIVLGKIQGGAAAPPYRPIQISQ